MKAWAPRSARTREQPLAPVSSRCAAISSRRINGVSPARLATRRAWARTRPTSSAFCSPVEQDFGRHVLGRMADEKVGAVRADERAAGGGILAALVAEESAGSAPRLRRRQIRRGRPRGCRRARSQPPGTASGRRRPAIMAAASADPFAPRGGDGDAELGHLRLDRIEPGRIRRRLGEEPVPPAHRPLEGVGAAAVGLVDGEHRAVEKAPPVGRRAGEQAVHRRRQPEHAEVVEEGVRRGGRGMVDLDPAAAFRPGRPAHHAGAEIDLAGPRWRPVAATAQAAVAALASGDLVEAGAADAAAGRQQRHRLEEVGLAGAVRPGEHHAPPVEPHRQRGIVPVAGQLQRRDRGTPPAGRSGGGPGENGGIGFGRIRHGP